ncbi:unnamed protein product [Gadus morhua 'NCC']
MASHTCWNETASQQESEVNPAFLVLNCVILSLTFVLGLPANLLVCWVVFRNQNLQTSNNALLVSLAASDLLKCSVDAPLFLFSFLSYGRHLEVSVSLCAVQRFSYALCSCVQLLTLVSISVERYQAIAFPFRTQRRKTRVCIWIPSIWVCGVLLAVVSLALSKQELYHMLCRRYPWGDVPVETLRSTDPFGAYVLVPVWGFSLTLIVIYYARIFKVVRQHRKRVYDNGIQLRPTTKQVWRWFSFAASEPGPAPRRTPPQRHHLKLLPAMCRPASSSTPPTSRLITVAEARTSRVIKGKPPRSPLPEIAGAVCILTPLARERGKKRMEGKLAQRFGYIIIVFTLFWVPMVVTLLMKITSWQNTNSLAVELETSAMVLTSVPAAVDPLIYTMVTRQFRSELNKILSSLSVFPRKFKG